MNATEPKNDPKGIETFLAQLDKTTHHCVLEATGNYVALLLQILTEHEIVVSMVNPKQTKHFARMMLVITKTDKVDAQLIALDGEKMQPAPYRMLPQNIQGLNQQKTLLVQLKKQLTNVSSGFI
ncbi:IS110 family transposase [Cardinium endosymbiont of Oedothorax gibbosus]|uniref:IS110 family transposase n=1 Tax=Cardinium endosymbiont of Oedothorax gibbosus TaxID=931101 RepID=UPI0021138D67|nr:IS110 family transposase [Cardinium endosymbiont of Oedothorax gibbosus]